MIPLWDNKLIFLNKGINMSEGVSKKSRYEIIAILRDELRIQSKLYFYYNGMKHQSTLKK
jgi:hypothetical protein